MQKARALVQPSCRTRSSPNANYTQSHRLCSGVEATGCAMAAGGAQQYVVHHWTLPMAHICFSITKLTRDVWVLC